MYENGRIKPRYLNILNGGGGPKKVFFWIPKRKFRLITEIHKIQKLFQMIE